MLRLYYQVKILDICRKKNYSNRIRVKKNSFNFYWKNKLKSSQSGTWIQVWCSCFFQKILFGSLPADF